MIRIDCKTKVLYLPKFSIIASNDFLINYFTTFHAYALKLNDSSGMYLYIYDIR